MVILYILLKSLLNKAHIHILIFGKALFALFHISEETLNLTYSCGLQQECDDAEEVDISIIHSELHKDRPGVLIQPFVPEQRLKGAVDEVQKNI